MSVTEKTGEKEYYFKEYIKPISSDIEQLKKDVVTVEIDSATILKIADRFDATLLKINECLIETSDYLVFSTNVWELVRNLRRPLFDFAQRVQKTSFSKIDPLTKSSESSTTGISCSTSVYSSSSFSSSSSSSSSSSAASSGVSGSLEGAKSKKAAQDDPILKQARWLLKQIPFFEQDDWLEEGMKRLSKFNLRIALGEEFPTMPNEPKEGLTIEERVYMHLFLILSIENPEGLKKDSFLTIDKERMQQASVQQRVEALTRVCIEIGIYGLSQKVKNDKPRTNNKEQVPLSLRYVSNEIEGLRLNLAEFRAKKEMEQQKLLAKGAYKIFFKSFVALKNESLKYLDEYYEDGCEMAAGKTCGSTEYLGLSYMAKALGQIWKTPHWHVFSENDTSVIDYLV
jgi:hypothetical protein